MLSLYQIKFRFALPVPGSLLKNRTIFSIFSVRRYLPMKAKAAGPDGSAAFCG